jgi:hypothetical protein
MFWGQPRQKQETLSEKLKAKSAQMRTRGSEFKHQYLKKEKKTQKPSKHKTNRAKNYHI